MIPFNPREEVTYVPESDRGLPEDEQSAFIIRGLTVAEDVHCRDSFGGMKTLASGEQVYRPDQTARNVAILHMALIGWRNFPPGSGENVGFRVVAETSAERPLGRRLATETLDLLSADLRSELAGQIFFRSRLSAQQGKVSG